MMTRDRLGWGVLTFGGVGASPVAPGTCGSFVAVIVGFLLYELISVPFLFPVLAGIASVLTILLGNQIEEQFGEKDPGAIVLDEVAGQWLALSFIPLVDGGPWAYLTCFLLFRGFDVLKPLGIRALEKYPRGWGVLLDDLAAGILAGLLSWWAWSGVVLEVAY